MPEENSNKFTTVSTKYTQNVTMMASVINSSCRIHVAVAPLLLLLSVPQLSGGNVLTYVCLFVCLLAG